MAAYQSIFSKGIQSYCIRAVHGLQIRIPLVAVVDGHIKDLLRCDHGIPSHWWLDLRLHANLRVG